MKYLETPSRAAKAEPRRGGGKLHILHAAFALGELLDGSPVFLAREQAHKVLSMRKPGKEVEKEQQHEDEDDPSVLELCFIAKEEDDALPQGKTRNAEERAHGAPLRHGDEEKDADEPQKGDRRKPTPFAAERDQKSPSVEAMPFPPRKRIVTGQMCPMMTNTPQK